jgi:MFS family permease
MGKLRKISKGTFESLLVRNYRLYFTGQAISLCGTWMQSIGQAWLVLQMTNSGTQLGLVIAAQTIPVLFFGPWGGLIADRFPKRKILYYTQSISALLALILGILVITNSVQLWMVYVLALCLGLVNAVDNPTRQTFIPELVGKEKLTNAVSLNSIEVNLARVIGPAIGGILIASLGMAPLFILNGVSFIAVLFALYMMNGAEFSKTTPVKKISGQLKEGFRYIRSNPILFDTLVMMSIIGTLTYEFAVSLPLLAQFTFHGTAETYAIISIAMGVGSMLGGFYVASVKKTSQKNLVVGAFLFGVTVLLASVMPILSLELLAIALVGFFSIIFLSNGNVTLQLESTPEMRGRVMSLWTVAFLGSTPIGGPIIGWIGEHIGPRYSLLLGGIAALFAAYIGFRSLKRRKKNARFIK